MRWIWIDKFLQFKPGDYAVAIKNVSLAEEHLHDHYPGFAVMPASLIIEGVAQTAGILVGQARDFKEKVILAKVSRATFDDLALPGDQLRYEAKIVDIDADFARTEAKIFKGDQLFGQVDIMFSHIDQNMRGLKFPEENFVFTDQFLRLLKGFSLGSGNAESQ